MSTFEGLFILSWALIFTWVEWPRIKRQWRRFKRWWRR